MKQFATTRPNSYVTDLITLLQLQSAGNHRGGVLCVIQVQIEYFNYMLSVEMFICDNHISIDLNGRRAVIQLLRLHDGN